MRYWIAILAVMTAQLGAYSQPECGQSAQLEYARRVEVNLYLPEYEVCSYNTSTVDMIDATVIAGAERPDVGLKLQFKSSTVQGGLRLEDNYRKIDYFDQRDLNTFLVKWDPRTAAVNAGFVRDDARGRYFGEFGIHLPISKGLIGTREQALESALHLLSVAGYDTITSEEKKVHAYRIDESDELIDLGPGLEDPELIGLELLRRSNIDTRGVELTLLQSSSEAMYDAEEEHSLEAKVAAQKKAHWKVRTPKGDGEMFLFVYEYLR